MRIKNKILKKVHIATHYFVVAAKCHNDIILCYLWDEARKIQIIGNHDRLDTPSLSEHVCISVIYFSFSHLILLFFSR